MLYRTTVDSPIGPLDLVASDVGIREIRLPLPHRGARPTATEAPDHAVLRRARAQLQEYFAGRRRGFDVPLDLAGGTTFQRAVWNALMEIPYGATLSYADVAVRLGTPGAARAVGGANGRNPIPIVVPCHRVVNASGALGGYGGPGEAGIQMKRWLLALEASAPPETARST